MQKEIVKLELEEDILILVDKLAICVYDSILTHV